MKTAGSINLTLCTDLGVEKRNLPPPNVDVSVECRIQSVSYEGCLIEYYAQLASIPLGDVIPRLRTDNVHSALVCLEESVRMCTIGRKPDAHTVMTPHSVRR